MVQHRMVKTGRGSAIFFSSCDQLGVLSVCRCACVVGVVCSVRGADRARSARAVADERLSSLVWVTEDTYVLGNGLPSDSYFKTLVSLPDKTLLL